MSVSQLHNAASVLVVDDEPFNRDLLAQELELMGHRPLLAANGREALDMVSKDPPDLILLDVMMPEMDGFEACRRLKQNEETRIIPVLIMTALDGFEARIKGIEAGADDFLTKPVNERELKARIRTSLKLKEAIDRKVERLTRVGQHLAKFVPDTILHQVSANPADPELGLVTKDVSVLFLDISGYARLCERVSEEVVQEMLERYFSSFLEVVHGAGGLVSNTMGDGLMAIFQDLGPADHAHSAVDSAVALFAETDRLNGDNKVQPLQLHMGLNSGRALVGSTRIEGRNGSLWVFSATGQVINLASRLAGLAGEGNLLVGPETAGRLGADYKLTNLGRQNIRNMDPIEVYSLQSE